MDLHYHAAIKLRAQKTESGCHSTATCTPKGDPYLRTGDSAAGPRDLPAVPPPRRPFPSPSAEPPREAGGKYLPVWQAGGSQTSGCLLGRESCWDLPHGARVPFVPVPPAAATSTAVPPRRGHASLGPAPRTRQPCGWELVPRQR